MKAIFKDSENCSFLVHQQVSADTRQSADSRQKLWDTKLEISVPIFGNTIPEQQLGLPLTNASTSILGQHMVYRICLIRCRS